MNTKLQLLFSFTVYFTLTFNLQAQPIAHDTIIPAYTLQDCIHYALQGCKRGKNAVLTLKEAKHDIKKGLWDLMPTVYADMHLAGSDGFIFAPQKHHTEQGNATMDFSIKGPFFDAQYFSNFKKRQFEKKIAEKTYTKTQEAIIEEVSKAYYTILFNQEHLESANSNFKILQILLHEIEIKYNNGFVEKLELDRIKIRYNHAQVEQKKTRHSLEESHDLLKFHMGMPIEENLTLKDRLQNIILENETIDDPITATYNLEYDILNIKKRMLQLGIKVINLSHLPGFSYSLGMQLANHTDTLFSKSWENEWEKHGWARVNVAMNLHLGFKKSQEKQKLKINLQKLNNEMADLENHINLQRKKASMALKTSEEKLKVEKENFHLAKEIFHIAQMKYRQGIASSFEIIQADHDLKEASTHYFSVLHEVLLNKIALEKVFGRLLSYATVDVSVPH